MLYILAFLLGTLALGVGAWKLGQRSDLWALLLAPVLLFLAWRVFPLLEMRPGEGVAAGVVVVQFGLFYVIIVGAALALILAAGAWWQRRSALVAGVLLVVLIPGAALIARRLIRGGPAVADSRTPPAATVAARETYLEGYTWAVDNGIVADSACGNGTPAFLEGCRHAVARH